MKKFSALSLAILLSLGLHAAQAQTPVGEVKGTATAHTEASAKGVMAGAQLVLPAQATGGAAYVGAFKDAPATTRNKVPVVVFLHGSSGLGLKAIGEWQQWLGSLGIASVAPDSFALPDRVTYKSPASKEVYEKIHALRRSEIILALQACRPSPGRTCSAWRWRAPARARRLWPAMGAASLRGASSFRGVARTTTLWSGPTRPWCQGSRC